MSADLRARIAEFLDRMCSHLQDDDECRDGIAAGLRDLIQPEPDAKDAEIGRLRRELAEANRRYEERSPTQWAYEQACHALEKHRERADAAEAEVKRLTDLNAQYADRAVENGQRAEQAEADLARSKDVAIREAEQVRSERNRYAERAEQAEALADEHAANARELGERLRQAEAERDRLRAAVERVKAAIRPLAEQKIPIVGVDVILAALTPPIDLAALDQAPAAEPVKRTIEEALDIVDGQFAEDRTAEQDGGGR